MVTTPENVPQDEAFASPSVVLKTITIGSPHHPVSHGAGIIWQLCYPWENNSCWLDASLQLLFVALSHNFSEFSSLVQMIQPGHPRWTLHRMFEQHLNHLSPNEPNFLEILKKQQNDLHQQLIEHQHARDSTSFELLMVCREVFQVAEYSDINFIHLKTWFYGLLWDVFQHSNGNYGFTAYFEFLIVEVHWCTRSLSNGPHLEVHSPPRHTIRYQQLSSTCMTAVFDFGLKGSLPLQPITLHGTHVGELKME